MSGITMDGRLYTLVRGEALDSLDSVLSLPHFLPHVADKLLVIWDGSPIHKGDVKGTCARFWRKVVRSRFMWSSSLPMRRT
jgi:hypothetical protein